MRKFPQRGVVMLLSAVVLSVGGEAAAQTNVINMDQLQKRGDVYYHPVTKVPYTGVVDASPCHECGASASYNMKDGKFHGHFSWNDEGGGDGSGYYKNGKKDGEWTSYDEGSFSIAYYKDDVLVNELKIDYGGWKLFDGNGKPTTVNYTSYVIEDGSLYSKDKTVLVNYVGNNRETFAIPNSVTTIKEGAFGYSACSVIGLTKITIGSGITDIKNMASAFESGGNENCASTLASIEVAAGNAKYSSENGVLFNKNKTVLIRYPVGKQDDSYTIPSSVTSIADNAFSGCSALTSITIPAGLKTIGERAFYGCSGLTSITIPAGVTSIGKESFNDCSGLTSVIIPAGVKTIGERVFSGCSGLTSVTIPVGVTSIGPSAFSHCRALTSVTIPSSVTSIGGYAFGGTGLKSIIIPAGVKTIGESAFGDGSDIKSLTIKNPTPPVIRQGSFSSLKTAACTLYVPQGSVSYTTAPGWNEFKHIGYIDPTGKVLQVVSASAASFATVQAEQKKAAEMQKTIDQYKKQLAECEAKKSDQCALIMYMLGNAYQQQATAAAAGGAKRDNSMAIQTYQRFLKEYPNSTYLPTVRNLLSELEIASLPPEQQQAARYQSQIDQYKKQLADCEIKKSDRCGNYMYMLGNAYQQQAAAAAKGGTKPDYSMATQTYQRLLEEYPKSTYSQNAKSQLSEIEIASLPPEQQMAARQRAAQTAQQDAVKKQAEQYQQYIDQYQKQLAGCEARKSDQCGQVMYKLGTFYLQQARIAATSGTKPDYSMATQTFQRLLREYPAYSQTAKQQLSEIEIMSLPPEKQQAARLKANEAAQQEAARQQAAKYQETIDQYKKQLAECGGQKNEKCAMAMYMLGISYSQQAGVGVGRGVKGTGGDNSMAIQTFKQFLRDYPTSQYAATVKQLLESWEIASLPPEQQHAARLKAQQRQYEEQYRQTIDQYKKQLAECGGQKSEQCAQAMYMLGSTYYQQASVIASLSIETDTDYSQAIQTYQQFLKDYPESQYVRTVKRGLDDIDKAKQQEARRKAEKQEQDAKKKAELQQQIEKYQQAIDQAKKQVAECEVKKNDQCAIAVYTLANAYYQQAIFNYQQAVANAGGVATGIKYDFSMAQQTYQRLLKEYPTSTHWQTAKQMLMNTEIMSLPPEQQQAARQKMQTELTQQTIDHYKKLLADCGVKKDDNCAFVIYTLAMVYYNQTNTNYSQAIGTAVKRDFSLSQPLFQRLLKEYPTSTYVQAAKSFLIEIEVASLPPEQQQAARQKMQAELQQQTIEQYKKQLAECETKKSDQCAVVMSALAMIYYQQAISGNSTAGVAKGDYSMAAQTYQRLLREYPESPQSQLAKQMLATIEKIQPQAVAAQQAVPAQSTQTVPKIAVYVFGAEAMALNKALATQLITTLANSGRYQAAENYKDFFNQAVEEQKGGAVAVSSKLVKKLGQQFGVEYVCVAEITTVSGEKRAAARIYSVKTEEITASGSSDVALRTQADVATVSGQIADAMSKKASPNR